MFPLIFLIAAAVQAPEEPPEDFTIRQVIRSQDLARRVTHFNRTLHEANLPGTVLRCNNVVELSDSDFPTTRIYGAICEIRFGTKRREYAICDNEDLADEAGIGQAALGPFIRHQPKLGREFRPQQLHLVGQAVSSANDPLRALRLALR